MNIKVLSEKQLDVIRGKMLVSKASQKELNDFMNYVTVLEALLERCDSDDYFGTEGWRRELGWD